MKRLLNLALLLISISLAFNLEAQDIDTEGSVIAKKDLTVGGGDISFVNDILGGNPKVVTINNGIGEFKVSTLGTPGGVLTLQRDGGLLLENRDNSEIIEFEVRDAGDFRLNYGAGGPTHMAINPSGIVGIGTTVFNSIARVNIKQGIGQKSLYLESTDILDFWTVEVDGGADYTWRYQGTSPGAFIDLSDGANYKTFSDVRLKSNIENVESVLSRVLQLRATNYNFKEVKSTHKTMGFIAQEVEKLFPDLVTEKEGYKTLSYATFSVLAIKAIQEQQQIIDQLVARIEALENK